MTKEKDFSKYIQKAEVLAEALPYIKKFHGKTIVIKIGGSVMVEQHLKDLFASDVVLLRYVGMNVVVVHGGGKEISRWMEKVGKNSVFIDGLRVTDHETMEITEMVLSGKINSDIVTRINQHGGKAVGLSGKDADLFNAKKIRSKEDKDLGFVGDVTSTNPELVLTLCEKGYIPVLSSVGRTGDGESVNMNADTVAASVAQAVSAEKLIYLTDVNGVQKNGELLQSLTLSDAKELLSHSEITGGMLPKLEYSIRALKGGVGSVHIISGTVKHSSLLEILTDTGIGTMIEG